MLDIQGAAKMSVFAANNPTGPRAECFADLVSGEMDERRREEMTHGIGAHTWQVRAV